MNRVVDIQKSSRTKIKHCTFARRTAAGLAPIRCFAPPSWRAATAQTGRGRAPPSCPRDPNRARRSAARASTRLRSAGAGSACRRTVQGDGAPFPGRLIRRKTGLSVGQTRQHSGFHQRRFAASRWSVDESHGEGVVRVSCLDPGLPETECCQAIHRGHGDLGEVREKSPRRASKDRNPFGTILIGRDVVKRRCATEEARRSLGCHATVRGGVERDGRKERALPESRMRLWSARPENAANRRPCPEP